ncbi:unnamed protein product [Knipowitschia caucasica]|uniref:CCDC66 domain-containing protein n=1 Tax=Knipowitschia caucasica TaxID=637954 RepID=A0AAV2MLE7_KNICA
MNLGDGLLFELDNGKPRLILLNGGGNVQTNPVKPRPRLPSVLSRLPSRLDTLTPRAEGQPIKKHIAQNVRVPQNKTGKGGAPVRAQSRAGTTSRTQVTQTPGNEVQTNAKVKAAKPKNVRANRKPEEPKKKAEPKVEPSNQSATLQDGEACLTNEQLHRILNVVQIYDYPPITEEIQSVAEPAPRETKGPKETKEQRETGNVPHSDKRSGGLLSWVEERPFEDRAALEAKKAQWKRELDQQVASKNQRSAPARLQGEDAAANLVSVQSSVSYMDLPAAVRSSLKVGEFVPLDEAALTQEQKLEQRKLWLQELDKQREENTERRRLEKLQHRQTEDPQLWASHFESLQRPPLAPPPCFERGQTGSSLSQWEEASIRTSVETSCSRGGGGGGGGGGAARASHLRTMTSLLDPAEVEERERRRLKQLEQQRAIELQMEERRRRREEEELQRKREEEEEELRLEQERDRLQRQYEKERRQRQHEKDTQRETHREPSPETELRIPNCSEPEPQSDTDADNSPELEAGPTAVNHHKETGVQTEEAVSLAPGPGLGVVDRAQVLQMLQMFHKDVGTEAYEPYSRSERSRRDVKRPEWNTQRPSRRFVPASQRYPEELQRQRQQSRLMRQAQLLSLQKNPPTLPPRLSPTPEHEPSDTEAARTSSLVETSERLTTERGRSPEPAAPDSRLHIRSDDAFILKPPETQPQPSPHCAATPQILQKTPRQEEIIRGLARLRQGLLQKQRELESDLSHSDQWPVPMTTYRREL